MKGFVLILDEELGAVMAEILGEDLPGVGESLPEVAEPEAEEDLSDLQSRLAMLQAQ